jgi:hypothetical protein
VTTALPPPAPTRMTTSIATDAASPVPTENMAQSAAPIVAMRTRLFRSARSESGSSTRTMAIVVAPPRASAAASQAEVVTYVR